MSKRRTFTPEFKAQAVLEELTGIKDKAEICREYRLRPQVFSRWREEFLKRAPEIFATKPSSGERSRPWPSIGLKTTQKVSNLRGSLQ